MRFLIDELEVHFPYELVYKEYLDYMKHLKNTLDNSSDTLVSEIVKLIRRERVKD